MQKIQTKWTTLRKLTVVLSLGAFALVAAQVAQADVYTDPVGFVTMTALGTTNAPGNNPYATLVGLGMTQVPVSRGNATAGVANQVGVNATLTPGQFNKTADNKFAYWIEITSGAWAGYQTDIVSNDAANVYTVVDLSGGLPATYKIYPHWTIGKLFGPNNEAGLLGGSSASVADQIQVWSVGSQSYATTYFYKTSGLAPLGWRSTTSAINESNAVVYIDQGLYLNRRVTTNLDVKVVGAVKLGSTVSTVYTNAATILGNVYAAGVTLGGSGLWTTNAATGLLGGSSASVADNIQVWVPGSQSYGITYFYKTSGLAPLGWRSTTSGLECSTNTIPLGASVYIVRRPGNPTFNWVQPQPYTP